MLRSRVMRPGLVTNEVLASLGPFAEILFTRLWMLADREGRLEDRPARIKAEAMPYYDVDVENLLESLGKNEFILRYRVRGVSYIAIHSFRKHQPVHPHEAQSVIPPPPLRNRKDATSQSGRKVRNVITCNGSAVTCQSIVTSTSTSIVDSPALNHSGVPPIGETTTIPEKKQTPKPTPKPTPPTPRKQPAREDRSSREGPHREEQKTHSPTPQDVALVRESLYGLAAQVGMMPPDDGIVFQVLDQGGGASGEDICSALVALWRRNKFQSMRSWGLVPLVVSQCFRDFTSRNQLKFG